MVNKIAFFLSILFFMKGYSATITSNGTGGGNWNNPTTWVGSVVPGAGDDVIIAVGDVITVNVNAAALSIHFNGGGNSSTININNGVTLTVAGMVNIAPPTAGTNDNTMNVGNGILTCNTLSTTNSGNNTRRCVVIINNGTLTCTGGFQMANNITRNKLTFTASGLLQLTSNANTILNGHFTASTGSVNYNSAGNQTVLALTYHSLISSNNGVKELSANTTVNGDLVISGNAQLDVTNNNYALTVGGNWIVNSTNSDPFVEQNGTVTFNTSAGTKTLTTVLAGGETFYNLVSNHTSTLLTTVNINVSMLYTHTNGVLDLNGNNLLVISNASANVTANMTGGLIKSSAAGSSVQFSDGIGDFLYVNFNGTDIGDAVNNVDLDINTGRICINQLDLYGKGTFTKTRNVDDVCTGGNNNYYGDVIFTATPNSARWRMGNGASQPDHFYGKARFNAFSNSANSNNNFIIGVNSVGNTYADSVIFTSTTNGGIYIGRSNGGNSNSHHFSGPVVVNVAFTGNVTFAEASATNPATVTIANTFKINSTSSSSGDVSLGVNNANSNVTITPTGQLINGTVTGATNIYLYNVVQQGTLQQTISNNGLTNSLIQIGSATAPCTFSGSVNFAAPNINIAYSNFYGSNNIFTMNGLTNNQNCTGGNLFAAATSNTFVNTGTVFWNLANTAPDTYLGDVFYNRTNTGALSPAYNTNCIYEGNISVMPGSGVIDFATQTNGIVTITGNANKSFTSGGTGLNTMKRIIMNKNGANFTLNNPIGMPQNGDLTLTNGKIITSSSSPLILLDETCTVPALTSTSTSYVDGPMRYDVTSTANQTLHFPIGKGSDCRPAILNIKHSSSTGYSYMAEVNNNSANALGWTLPPTLSHVSNVRWWDIERTVTSTSVSSPTTHVQGNQTITLFYGVNDGVLSPSFLAIAKNTHTALTSWIDIGGSGATAGAGSVVCTNTPSPFNSFSRFTLANKLGGDNPLPIQLLEFNAKAQSNKLLLEWSTLMEYNNAYFTVEKSTDALEFEELEKVDSKSKTGNANGLLNYSCYDTKPVNGINYYRLKQTDFSGRSTYYPIRNVLFGANNQINIYPNPCKGEAYINKTPEEISEAYLISSLGVKINLIMERTTQGSMIKTNDISEGVYFLIVKQGEEYTTSKLIIRR